jgi:hypothetical protein
MSLSKLKNIVSRMLAMFVATALGVVGTGAIIGVEVWQAALMAGIGGVATVLEGLSRAYLKDGKLTMSEINDVFSQVDQKLPKK